MIGMPIGVLIGVAMGIGVDDMALGFSLGPAMGAGICLAIGVALEAKNKNNVRKSTHDEQSCQRKLMTITLLGLILLVVVEIMLFMKNRTEMGI